MECGKGMFSQVSLSTDSFSGPFGGGGYTPPGKMRVGDTPPLLARSGWGGGGIPGLGVCQDGDLPTRDGVPPGQDGDPPPLLPRDRTAEGVVATRLFLLFLTSRLYVQIFFAKKNRKVLQNYPVYEYMASVI